MKLKINLLILVITLPTTLLGCSYVKSLFPDKEKDYQYTTEIPVLILPDDLKKSQIPGLTNPTPTLSTSLDIPTEESGNGTPITNQPLTDVDLPVSEPGTIDTGITVQRIKLNDSDTGLRLNAPFIKAWRIVNKSLSRKSIEVVERNQDTKLFTVKFDPEEDQKSKEDSYWDDVTFLLNGFHGNEKTFLIKLDDTNDQTDISIIDENKKPSSDPASIKLLTLIEETIKADLATN